MSVYLSAIQFRFALEASFVVLGVVILVLSYLFGIVWPKYISSY